ncbi:hypothetical protein [Kribbella sp. VKM Ac-2568]|uniref:hypothetical protein n=1 Tax=Kribbella sp. VKM Ac-2568 TaxID=2512219 RepID=UPI00104ECFC4|nr:hypothetical protein [Kribbella sp. VKM Ac-2568]TCM50076.1 hypothetical protein EV648_102117 [Kribbella sp. VKM Ac-2568]
MTEPSSLPTRRQLLCARRPTRRLLSARCRLRSAHPGCCRLLRVHHRGSCLRLVAGRRGLLTISPDDHPIRHVRAALDEHGILRANQLSTADDGSRVLVGGVVTHRQRPATAAGVTFLNLLTTGFS